MCGFIGWVNCDRNLIEERLVIEDMTKTISHRGPDDSNIYMSDYALLGHRRLTVVDPEGGAQPMSKKLGENSYTIVYNGELYNTEEIRAKLKDKGYIFESYSDTEVLLISYIEWGEKCLEKFNGIFAFAVWDKSKRRLFMARDPLGVKPLFYSKKGEDFLFGSELKAILKHPAIEPKITSESLLEIFGLGPARSLGSGIFKGIYEVPPGCQLIYEEGKLQLREYWKLECKPHEDDFDTTVEKVRNLLIDAINRQLVSDVPLCTFLSGGLDSSAISAIAAKSFKEQNRGVLNTFSIDYKDNDIYFTPDEFQPNSDEYWAKYMSDCIQSEHHNILIDSNQLVSALKKSVIANDLPGMADIDSSLLLFCNEVRKKYTVALSGECADEIFGGYPWFWKAEFLNADTFPWSGSIKERRNILSKEFSNLPLEEYVDSKYRETLKKVPKLKGETAKESRMREMFYLNLKWFMITLLNRKDRMSMASSLEVRVPFADYRIVEYAFNIPWNMKHHNEREKGLLRQALVGILPEQIIHRKKSPYPKTHNPIYSNAVECWMRSILKDKNSPINQIIDKKRANEIVNSKGKSFDTPWFGQLMKRPQLLAYLIQIDYWMREYKVQLV